MRNIHLLTCSNRVDVIISDLQITGLITFDAHLKQDVLVTAPVLLGMHDNPQSSEVVNHMGSAANSFLYGKEVHTFKHTVLILIHVLP